MTRRVPRRIFDEWESQSLTYDFRIPNFLIGSYCRKGLLQKAESLIGKAILKGEKPDWKTWFYMATGYLKNNQTLVAVEAMRKRWWFVEISGSQNGKFNFDELSKFYGDALIHDAEALSAPQVDNG
ncbi:hypothetical protein Pint_36277 [Pistacia integerrima]|uniref:Uncharacterized protein n=1 Tax=Pistacia integerrima TaxID=434235 RepID=A0ACC0Y3U1_9ROSI|nr:hypothetical protein Pint_36277 [Pistacia integerrima]